MCQPYIESATALYDFKTLVKPVPSSLPPCPFLPPCPLYTFGKRCGYAPTAVLIVALSGFPATPHEYYNEVRSEKEKVPHFGSPFPPDFSFQIHF